ncbi:phosphocholine cytidylyltransferase family protein [Helicobacter sp. faydin-H20]|uniref:phosphocholine cytidylyltransferase family protein n=1 Tax=Helicobacter anatolicus TaxID=2905874 RepID=UPI001E57F58C|nr:phosphocholine cytidylyltransferase family protein [Helicobacter anatolicus]MCE3037123.1 phosphocholine cytidylyltransferase family protein [Helicobacter anatolicus]
MRVLILAAGMGKRLMPLTRDVPKCMVMYKNKALIDYLLEVFQSLEVDKIALVGGYKFEVLQEFTQGRIDCFYENKNFDSTNMVSTLFCAKEFLEQCIRDSQDVLISYADIIFTKKVLFKMMEYKGDVGVGINTKWRLLWEKRFANPLDDAETLKIMQGKIKEIGKKPKSYEEIEGQYMGLFKISHQFLPVFMEFYTMLDSQKIYDGKDFANMYMTSFLQQIIDRFDNVEPIFIDGGWREIDSIEDLNIDEE